jgi:hypothetical protein
MPTQFLVPQFIDVEDKIIGPITVRQFIIMIVALVVGALFYRLFSFLIFIVLTVLDFSLAGGLAFAKVNGRPVHFFLLNFIQTLKRPNIRIWNKASYVSGVQEVHDEKLKANDTVQIKESLSGSKLQDLSLVINTGGLYSPDEDIFENDKKEDPVSDKK